MQLPDVYNNERRYIFNNWTATPFVCSWDGVSTTVQSGESIELPEYKAFHFTKHLVNAVMGDTGSVDSPEARKPFEDKTLVEITAGMDFPALASLKAQIKEEVLKEEMGNMKSADVSVEQQTPVTNEFADIKEEEAPKAKKVEAKKK